MHRDGRVDAIYNAELHHLMDHINSDILKDPGGKPGLTADWDSSESFSPEKDQWRCSSSCLLTEDLTTNGSWSQRSISRSLQRAETLLRSTFNPSLKWLFSGRSQDEEEEEGNFVVAQNLVSRSSARLLRLQQALLTVAPQWQSIGRVQTGFPQVGSRDRREAEIQQVCAKGLPTEGSVLLLPSSSSSSSPSCSSSSLQGHYSSLCRLLEQRSLLLFIHEYTRRAQLTAAYISRVSQLLHQKPSSCSSLSVGLASLSQELRVHLNHWSCLSSRVQSDQYLRAAVVQQAAMLQEIRQSLQLLGLQALLLMERYVHAVLSAAAQAEFHCVPREVLQDILSGTELYNQAVEEQRAQHSATQLRTALLQQAHYATKSRGHHPAACSVKQLMRIIAAHHADTAAKQLHCWASEQSQHICMVHDRHRAHGDDRVSQMSRSKSVWHWEQLLRSYSVHPHSSLQSSAHHSSHEPPSVFIPDLQLDSTICPVLAERCSVQQRPEILHKDQARSNHPNQCQTNMFQTNVDALNCSPQITNLEKQTSLEKCKPVRNASAPSFSLQHLSAPPLSRFCQQDQSSIELLFQVLVTSSDLLAPLVLHTPEADQVLPHTATDEPVVSTAPITDSAEENRLRTEEHVEGTQQECAKMGTTTSPGFVKDGDPDKEQQADIVHRPRSVQWSDLGQSLVFADLFGQYSSLLWTLCSRGLWLQLHVPAVGNAAGSINLHDNHGRFHVLQRLSQASKTDLLPKECRAMLEDFSLCLLVSTAHAQWDSVMCRSLGSGLKDKCLTDMHHGSRCATPLSRPDSGVTMSKTMQHFLQLFPPVLSSLCCHQSNSRAAGSFSLFPSSLSLQRQTVSLASAAVQLSAAWVMSKSFQFLSSWSLNKFLLITQGDLKVLTESVDTMMQQMKSLMIHSDNELHSSLHNHYQLLLRQQLAALDRAVPELQTFSLLVLKTFSIDCKRMSGEIFEQTFPSAIHWRPNRTGFPSNPSEYAALAAQTVIGQVLEGVAPLSDDARVQALSITMTAFMEAWMEHILKQKVKFSVQGALQLKQDFDCIRELIQSDRYGLSADLHQRLLNLRVFQQVDAAVVCLLQQPQNKPYLQSRAWEPFTFCCRIHSRRNTIDAAVGSSITNLRSMEGEDMSVMTSDLPPVDSSTPGEPYLAPSLALGAAQQEWLDLRIHYSTRRWRLPGLQCLTKSEP